MKELEKSGLSQAYRPLSPWAYFGLNLLYAVPVLGWAVLIFHALTSRNINRKNYARSYFCIYFLLALALVALYASGLKLTAYDVIS